MQPRLRTLLAGFFPILAFMTVISATAPNTQALTYEFHGFFESNLIARDTTGFQYGFLENVELVQQRNTLKFDVDTHIRYSIGDFSLDKAHLTFRGAYDAIFKLRYEEYKNIRKETPSRFDYGLYDIEYEMDLREANLDFTYDGHYGSGFLRLGRQIVSWGETSGLTITDNINPPDNSFQMFFLNPDDLKIPLWMARLNYDVPKTGFLRVNFDLVAIPDVRPQQWAPLYGNFDAPYVSIHPFRDFFGPPSLFLKELGLGAAVEQGLTVPVLLDWLDADIRESVDTSQTEWGGRVMFGIGTSLTICSSYFEGISDMPGFEFGDFRPFELFPGVMLPAPARVKLVHPWTRTYGGSFTWVVPPPLDLIVKGEFGRTENVPIFLPVSGLDLRVGPTLPIEEWAIRGYTLKPVNMWMVGIDKDVWARWFASSQINVGVQWIHKQICDWEDKLEDSHITKRNTDYFSLLLNWYWLHGNINPMVFALVDTQLVAMVQTSVHWTISKHWYAKASVQSFFGKSDWKSNATKSEFAPFVSKAGEATVKIGFQW